MTETAKEIAVFIPCYNEESRLNIEVIKRFILENEFQMDFYFINDGSTDGTATLIENKLAGRNSTFLINLDRNLGKGNAIREGALLIESKAYKYFGFIDADLDIPLNQILKLKNALCEGNALMAISRRNLYSNISLFRLRSISSVAMKILANKIIGFNPGIGDTQCGCKFFKTDILKICFGQEFISEWLFDIELFLRIKGIANYRNLIIEVPLEDLSRHRTSNFKFQHNFRIIRQLFLINRQYN